MRISQLLHAMDKDEWIVIHDGSMRISNMCVYAGEVGGIKKDDPINRYHIHHIFADCSIIVVLAEKQKERR